MGEVQADQIVIAPIVPCANKGDSCSSGYRGDRCEGCLRNGMRAVLGSGIIVGPFSNLSLSTQEKT